MIAIFRYPSEQAEYEHFIADNPVNHVWHDVPSHRIVVSTGDDIPTENSDDDAA